MGGRGSRLGVRRRGGVVPESGQWEEEQKGRT